MEERQLTGIVERDQVGHGRMQGGETVAQRDGGARVGRIESRASAGAAGVGVIAVAQGMLGNPEHIAVGVEVADRILRATIAGVHDGDEVVDAVIASAQEDKEQFLAAESDIAFGQGTFEKRGDVG